VPGFLLFYFFGPFSFCHYISCPSIDWCWCRQPFLAINIFLVGFMFLNL